MNTFTTLQVGRLFWRRNATEKGTDRILAILPITSFAIGTALLLIVAAGARALWRIEEMGGFLQLPTIIALALLLIPLLTLGGAAAKLAARRRDNRLSSLRLLGATNLQVGLLTVFEAAGGALFGALLGTVGYLALAPLVGRLSFAGAPLGNSMWLPFGWFPLMWLMIIGIACFSAVLGLRNIIVTPLGVRTRQRPKLARGRRVLAAFILIVTGFLTIAFLSTIVQAGGLVAFMIAIFVAFGCCLLALDAIGPWFLRVHANSTLRRANSVEKLLSARMTLEDPLAASRQVSGLAVTSFVGVIGGAGVGLIAIAGQAAPDNAEILMWNDLRTGIYLTLAIAFIMVACTVAINQCATMLDRARVQVALDRLGVPNSLLARAARRSVMSNVLFVVLGSGLLGALLVLPLLAATVLMNPAAILTMVLVFVGGILVVRLAASIAGSLVPGILAHPDRVL